MSAADFEEFEELETLEQVENAVEERAESSASAQTSSESESANEADSTDQASSSTRLGWMSNLTVYDAMLLASLVTISLACVLMLMELFSFGFPFFQWRTSEAFVEPVRPPV